MTSHSERIIFIYGNKLGIHDDGRSALETSI